LLQQQNQELLQKSIRLIQLLENAKDIFNLEKLQYVKKRQALELVFNSIVEDFGFINSIRMKGHV